MMKNGVYVIVIACTLLLVIQDIGLCKLDDFTMWTSHLICMYQNLE